MNITILTQGSRGDVQPYVALGLGLKRAGYHVRMPAPEIFRGLITDAGLEYVPSSGFDPQAFMRNPEMQSAARQGGQFKILLALLRKAGPMLENMLDEYWRASAGAQAIIASTLVFGIPDCAEKRGLPCVYAPIHALACPTSAFPSPFFAPFGARPDHFANVATHRVVQLAFWGMIRQALNRWRVKMGLHPIGNYFDWMQERHIPTVYGFSPSVLPIPSDWPPEHHVSGYWFLDEPTSWQAPKGLARFLESGPPPVCIGFGSMDTQDPQRITRTALEALSISGQRGILLTGWGGLGAQSLPETVYTIESIPHSWLFPHMAAVVHHGGAGTTAAGLRAGIPAVITPLGGDQPFWADRIERLGAGIRSASYFKLTSERLAADISRVVTDAGLSKAASAISKKIQAEDGVGKAVNLIQKYLDG